MQNVKPSQSPSLITRQAQEQYKKGNYLEAKRLYELAAQKIGRKAFAINIRLCSDKLRETTNNISDSESSTGQKITIAKEAEYRFRIPIKGEKLILSLDIDYITADKISGKEAVLLVEFSDAKDSLVDYIPNTFSFSSVFRSAFRYLKADSRNASIVEDIDCDTEAEFISLTIRPFLLKDGDKIILNKKPDFQWQEKRNKYITTSARQKSTIFDELPFGRPDKISPKLKVASILDIFTDKCFASLVDLIRVSPRNWKSLLQAESPDILFVESAWHGNRDSWLYGIASYQSPPHDELTKLVEWCKKEGIPTIFWNKEDPVNFNRFQHRAPLFDYIFTTDSNSISNYKAICPNARHVDSLMFAANLDIHNPCREGERLDEAFFAGSYYADEHPERRDHMDNILRTCKNYGLTIYDRMSDSSPDQKHHFQFPSEILPFVRNKISYEELCRIYSSYRLGINVNSILDSPTMFSRRVFEILASGTPVISTPSLGVQTVFDDIVPICDNAENTSQTIRTLFTDNNKWEALASKGWREVCRRHTYQDRLAQILSRLHLTQDFIAEAQLIVVHICEGEQAINKIRAFIERSTKKPDLLIVACSAGFTLRSELVDTIRPFCRAASIPQEHIYPMLKADYPDAIIAIIHSAFQYGASYLEDVWHFSRRSNYEQIPNSAIGSESSDHSYADNDFGYPLLGSIPAYTVAAKGDSGLIGEAIGKLIKNVNYIESEPYLIHKRPPPEQ